MLFSRKRAVRDLHLIYDQTDVRWGAPQAEKYISEIRAACRRLGGKPRLGKSVDHIRLGYFMLICGSHNIFFRDEKALIVIVRILHTRMDIKRHL